MIILGGVPSVAEQRLNPLLRDLSPFGGCPPRSEIIKHAGRTLQGYESD